MSYKKIHPLTVVMKGKISYIDQNYSFSHFLVGFTRKSARLPLGVSYSRHDTATVRACAFARVFAGALSASRLKSPVVSAVHKPRTVKTADSCVLPERQPRALSREANKEVTKTAIHRLAA